MKNNQDTVYITYINPLQFVVYENEIIDFTIEEINSLSYDHSLLHRIVGKISNCFNNTSIDYLVCGDGGLGIKKDYGLSNEDMLLHYNDLLCKLYLGGLNAEAITIGDIAAGGLFESKSIWPVDFGNTWNSHIHAELRMRVVGVTDAIILYKPQDRMITIKQLKEKLVEGSKISDAIPNLSTFHLINGITEFHRCSWSSSLTFLWVVVEEIIDYLWDVYVIKKVTGDNSKKRREALKDTRTYTMAVKQELLLQIGVLDKDVFNSIFIIRQSRNKLIHEGKMISEKDATLLYDAVGRLLDIVIEMKSE